MQEIETGVFIETSYPGVTLGALILPHGTILIDAPLRSEDIRAWRGILINLGGSLNRLLVNLDAHPDRTLGARAMECTILAHQKTAQVFRSRPSIFKGQNGESGSEWETYNDAVGTRWAIPDVTFSQRICLHWGPPDVILEHHPGPASGSIWVIIPQAGVVFTGDTVLCNQPPFLADADIPDWLESLDVLYDSYKNYKMVSGRGGPIPVESVRAQSKELKSILKGLEKLARRNAKAEAVNSLIPGLISDYRFPVHLQEQYIQRLRHGLSQYYLRCYRPMDILDPAKTADGDQSNIVR